MIDKINLKKEIGTRLKEIRENKMHMSKSDFADFINMKKQYLGMLENGQRGLTIEKVLEICDKTGISSDYLLRGIENSLKENAKQLLSKYSNEEIYNAFEILKDITLLIK